jgi:hypothetical protein
VRWNNHSWLRDKHAFLSPSRYHWVNYSPERLIAAYNNHQAAAMGTKIHKLAADLIELGVRLPNVQKTLNMYVNDAIGFGMSPEVQLVYSKHAFGTADSIFFDGDILRIHDLKTGRAAGKQEQVELYAAFFCLEYAPERPFDIELRIYQNDEVIVWEPDVVALHNYMDTIVKFDELLRDINGELYG